jgi:hypothetical protein
MLAHIHLSTYTDTAYIGCIHACHYLECVMTVTRTPETDGSRR